MSYSIVNMGGGSTSNLIKIKLLKIFCPNIFNVKITPNSYRIGVVLNA